ncbi:hypothetical protein C8R45DRAFT_1182941 [Mycena sanguinolenta]|nr:hypothetical protein C8R45DRAFT_1182941 [Mycena sanguinolenta]
MSCKRGSGGGGRAAGARGDGDAMDRRRSRVDEAVGDDERRWYESDVEEGVQVREHKKGGRKAVVKGIGQRRWRWMRASRLILARDMDHEHVCDLPTRPPLTKPRRRAVSPSTSVTSAHGPAGAAEDGGRADAGAGAARGCRLKLVGLSFGVAVDEGRGLSAGGASPSRSSLLAHLGQCSKRKKAPVSLTLLPIISKNPIRKKDGGTAYRSPHLSPLVPALLSLFPSPPTCVPARTPALARAVLPTLGLGDIPHIQVALPSWLPRWSEDNASSAQRGKRWVCAVESHGFEGWVETCWLRSWMWRGQRMAAADGGGGDGGDEAVGYKGGGRDGQVAHTAGSLQLHFAPVPVRRPLSNPLFLRLSLWYPACSRSTGLTSAHAVRKLPNELRYSVALSEAHHARFLHIVPVLPVVLVSLPLPSQGAC